MPLKQKLLALTERLDALRSPRSGSLPRKSVLGLLVHSLYVDPTEPDREGIYPHERMTLEALRVLLDRLLESGHHFLPASRLASQRELPSRATLLTFDDGYFNFTRALPLLHELQVPATLFVTTGAIERRSAFWWDTAYRRMRAKGLDERRIRRQLETLKTLPPRGLARQLGSDVASARPRSDLDRPLTLDELRDVAREPLVELGNHTHDHAALPFLSREQKRNQLEHAQRVIRSVAATCRCVAFPNGDTDIETRHVASELGFRVGLTLGAAWSTVEGRLDARGGPLDIGRVMPSGTRSSVRQAAGLTSPNSMTSRLRALRHHEIRTSNRAPGAAAHAAAGPFEETAR